jgi:hypothetical protein
MLSSIKLCAQGGPLNLGPLNIFQGGPLNYREVP